MHDVVPGACHTVQHYIDCWVTFFETKALEAKKWSINRNEVSKTFNKIFAYTEKTAIYLLLRLT